MAANISKFANSWKNQAGTCLLLGAWLYINWRSLVWFGHSLAQISPPYLIIIIGGISGFIIYYYRQQKDNWSDVIFPQTQLFFLPLMLMLGCGWLAIALTWILDLEQLGALLFFLGSYGLAGLFVEPLLWRKNLPVAAICSCLLPFIAQFDSGIGIPARMLTARIVEQLLSVWQVGAISSHDIIVLENGIARIDLPCSGLKSLGTGTFFLLALTWLENRGIGLRWMLIFMGNLFLLIAANTTRILALVIIAYILKQPQFAEILHLPLGVLGFAIAIAASWLCLQTIPKNSDLTVKAKLLPINHKFSQFWLIAAAFSLALTANLRYSPAAPLTVSSISWPAQIVSERLPLTAAEQRFFNLYKTTAAPEKRRFIAGEISGSLIAVASTSWQNYHPPELCLIGAGLKLDKTERKQLAPEILGRWLSLQNGQMSAAYWLQAPHQTTDDFLQRMWSEITHKNKTWVLVSILFDRHLNSEDEQLIELTTDLYQAIDNSFQESPKSLRSQSLAPLQGIGLLQEDIDTIF